MPRSVIRGTDAVCVKYGPGAAVGVDLACPRAGCDFTTPGSAEVVNDYGVRDPIPRYCKLCGLRLDVVRIVDIEAEAADA